MSHRERASHTVGGRNSGIKDVGLFVENYKNLLDKLYPVFALCDAALYIVR